MRRIKSALGHRRAAWLIAGLAGLLCLPALWTGLMTDDYWLLAGVRGIPGYQEPRAATDLFAWYRTGDVETMKRLGTLHWWTQPDARFALWRPLSSLTHWLDFTLWPDRPVPMHAQNILWLGALILVVGHLHRRFGGATWVAGLATLLYAIDDARAIPAMSIANRNGLIAAFLALSALALHARWRETGRWAAGTLAPPLLLTGLLANEGAVAVGAFLLCYAIFLDRGGPRRGLLCLTPHALVVVLWRVAYQAGGYGVWGVDRYADPLFSPLLFVQAVLFREPMLLLGQWGVHPLLRFLPTFGVAAVWLLAVAWMAAVTALLWPFLRRDATSRFWYASMLLALVPSCAVEATPRLLLYGGVGASALLARFLAAVHEGGYGPASAFARKTKRAFYVALVTLHVFLAPVLLLTAFTTFHGLWSRLETGIREAPLEDPAGKTLVAVNGRLLPKFLPLLLGLDDRPLPRRIRYLGPSRLFGSSIRLTREDARTLTVRPEGGFYRKGRYERAARFAAGDRLQLPAMTVEIREVDHADLPTEVAYVFDVPLEDDSLIWIRRRRQALERFTPPAIGETLVLGGD